ncbi:MAG: efflux RND transporter periplasmic adaptor subunit [Acidobacteriia bacterium]|nr:efflux RND transporter periplasmic adaptor subunit [Terriglobia bacterium]
MKRKILLPLLVLVALSGGVVYYKAVTRPRPLVLTGIVTTHDVFVSSQISGQISQLLVKEGDNVKAGELVGMIEPKELRAEEAYYAHSERGAAAQVTQAEAALKYQEAQTRDQIRQAEAALASTQAQQAEAAANLERARLDYQRAEGLFKDKIISVQGLDQARTTFEAAEAHVESLAKQVEAQAAAVALARSTAEEIAMRRSQLLAGRYQRAAAEAQKNTARIRLDYTEIRAPISGVVAEVAARQGEVVNPAQPILDIVNPDDLWVRADVEETYIDRIRLGDKLSVRLPSGDERTGTVFYRGVDADYATQRDVSRSKRDIKTFEIRLRVDNSDRRLWPGLTAYVTLPPQDLR